MSNANIPVLFLNGVGGGAGVVTYVSPGTTYYDFISGEGLSPGSVKVVVNGRTLSDLQQPIELPPGKERVQIVATAVAMKGAH